MAWGFNPVGPQQSEKWNTQWGKDAYNAKPYEGYTQQQGQWKNNYLGTNNPLSGFARNVGAQVNNLGQQYGGFARWGAGAAAPDSPEIGGFMRNLGSGRQAMLGDAAKSMAGASVAAGRGGYGVTGGWSPEAAARQQAMDSASRMYSDDYSKAVGWTSDLYGSLRDSWQDAWKTGIGAQLGALQSAANTGVALGNQELQGLNAGTQYAQDMFGRRAGDYDADTQYNRGAWGREQEFLNSQRQQRQAQMAEDQKQAMMEMLRNAYFGPGNKVHWDPRFLQGEFLKSQGLIQRTSDKGRLSGDSPLYHMGDYYGLEGKESDPYFRSMIGKM
jgi:hypothetical protein